MSFGSDLQLEREGRGISLEAIAEGTKVSARHLRALEADDTANMPGGVFNRGMVRSYCRFVGLDEDEWLARFSARDAPPTNLDLAQFAENVKRSRPPVPGSLRSRWLLVVALVGLLTASAYASWRYVVQPRMRPEAPPAATTRGSAP